MGALDAGRMDRRITLRNATVAINAKGEAIETYSDLATVWAEVRDPTGREVFASEQRAAQIDRVFVIRWRTGVTNLTRIVYDDGALGSQTYDVVEVAEIGRREGLALRAMARRATT